MINSGLPEFFGSCLDGSSGCPNIVEKEISGLFIDWEFGIELVGCFGLNDACGAIGADLGSVFGSSK